MRIKAMKIEKLGEDGTGTARIATLSAVDSDGDTYTAGAFNWPQGGGQWAQILPAHDKCSVPLGKAWVYEQGDAALADFSLNLQTQPGQDWYAALKFDLAKGAPIQEWSYGYDVLDAAYEQRGPDQVRVIKRLNVFEISPVLRGAGEGTGTLAIKSAALKADHYAGLIAALGELASGLKGDASALSATGLKQLREIHAALGTALVTPAGRDVADAALADQAVGEYLQTLTNLRLAGHA